MFPLKEKVDYYSRVIYSEVALVTKIILERQFVIRWNEHKDKNSKSKPAKYLREDPTHKFSWTIFSKDPENFCKCTMLEAYCIKTTCPTLNEQIDNDILAPFRNCIFYMKFLFLILLKNILVINIFHVICT